MKVIVVKFGHDYSTPSRATKGLKNSKIAVICIEFSKIKYISKNYTGFTVLL